ncbi:MAG: HEPN domain-containing protein [bacterium]
MTDDEKNALIEHRIKKALNTIDEVDFLIDNNRLYLAVNRIYYAIFYLLSAVSLKYNFPTSKHQQLIGWFNKEFIASGKIDRKYGKIIHNAYKNRSLGDYDDFVEFDIENVKNSFEEMKDFVGKVRRVLSI